MCCDIISLVCDMVLVKCDMVHWHCAARCAAHGQVHNDTTHPHRAQPRAMIDPCQVKTCCRFLKCTEWIKCAFCEKSCDICVILCTGTVTTRSQYKIFYDSCGCQLSFVKCQDSSSGAVTAVWFCFCGACFFLSTCSKGDVCISFYLIQSNGIMNFFPTTCRNF